MRCVVRPWGMEGWQFVHVMAIAHVGIYISEASVFSSTSQTANVVFIELYIAGRQRGENCLASLMRTGGDFARVIVCILSCSIYVNAWVCNFSQNLFVSYISIQALKAFNFQLGRRALEHSSRGGREVSIPNARAAMIRQFPCFPCAW